MARIAGVDLPREKKVSIALAYVFGIGRWHVRGAWRIGVHGKGPLVIVELKRHVYF